MSTFISPNCPEFWQTFVSERSSSLFHSSDWAKVMAVGYGGDVRYCWFERDGAPTVALLGALLDFKVVRVFYAALPYGGLIGNDDDAVPFLAGLEPLLRKEGAHQIQIAEPRHVDILETAEYEAIVLARHQTALAEFAGDPEQLLAALKRSVRKNVRKAAKSGVVVEALTDDADLGTVFDLYLMTMARNNAAAKYPASRFESIHHELASIGKGVILVARYEGKIIGSNTLICSGDTVHDVQLSYDHEYQHLRATDALVYASMEWAMAQGRVWFDFMGSPEGDDALEQFKAKWLAERTTTATYTKTLSPLRGAMWQLMRQAAGHPVGAQLSRHLRRGQS